MQFQINPIEIKDQVQVSEIVRQFWEDTTVVEHGAIFDTQKLSGIKAVVENQVIGILHYMIKLPVCEIITLASLHEGLGVGSSLLESMTNLAKDRCCTKLCLTTTNDNLHALGFYQRQGFHLVRLDPGAVNKSRIIKPAIPEVGDNLIPIRDELYLEKQL